jgi:hypothetical protein
LSVDYRFFTPGPLYAFVPGVRARDPFQDFVRTHPGAAIFTLTLDQLVFTGMGEPWDHVLYGVPAEHFATFMAWARTLSFVMRDWQWLVRVRPMLVTMLDPLFVANNPVANQVPSIEIGVLALDTNKGQILCDDQNWRTGKLPNVTRTDEVFRDTKVYARAVFNEDSNPWARVEEDQLDPSLGLSPSEAYLLRAYGDRKPLKPPEVVSLESRPIEEQQEIRRFINQVKGMSHEG